MILTAKVGLNSDLFPDVLKIHMPEGSTVADVTYGTGIFWRKVPKGKYKLLLSDLISGIDMRKLPYRDASIDCVVIDPPYMHTGGYTKASIDKAYRNNRPNPAKNMKDVIKLYMDGIMEAHRVLKPKGILILKCMDTIESGKQCWLHKILMDLKGFTCIDLFILVLPMIPTRSSTWTKQYHGRKNHSFFLVHRKLPD